jgi:hypothetical protein
MGKLMINGEQYPAIVVKAGLDDTQTRKDATWSSDKINEELEDVRNELDIIVEEANKNTTINDEIESLTTTWSSKKTSEEITKITDGTIKINADTVDGKHADYFATADHNHDDKYAPIDINTGVMSVTAGDGIEVTGTAQNPVVGLNEASKGSLAKADTAVQPGDNIEIPSFEDFGTVLNGAGLTVSDAGVGNYFDWKGIGLNLRDSFFHVRLPNEESGNASVGMSDDVASGFNQALKTVTKAGTGLKITETEVTNENELTFKEYQMDIDETVVFILDGGNASNLD